MHIPHLSNHLVFQVRDPFVFLQIPFSAPSQFLEEIPPGFTLTPAQKISKQDRRKISPSIAARRRDNYVMLACLTSNKCSTPGAIDCEFLRLSCVEEFCGGVGVKPAGMSSKSWGEYWNRYLQEHERVPNLEKQVMRKMWYLRLHIVTNLVDIIEKRRGMQHNISSKHNKKTTKCLTANTVVIACDLKTLTLAVKRTSVDRSSYNQVTDLTLNVLKIGTC